MPKIHTRVRRKNNLTIPKTAPNRPKTFKTEVEAKKYAEKLNYKSYELLRVKKGKKFQVLKK